MRRTNSGVTLIALIITIIVLLILAGITISMIAGDNGILNRAVESKIETDYSAVREAISLAYSEYKVELEAQKIEQGNSGKVASLDIVNVEKYALQNAPLTFWNYLIYEKECMDEDGVINVESLVGSNISTGKGNAADKKDVYILEETDDKYILKYYDDNASSKDIWQVSNVSTKKIAIKYFGTDEVALEIEYEDGMTWGDWLDSKYNTFGMTYDYNIRYHNRYYIADNTSNKVDLEDIMDENEEYVFIAIPK